MSKKLALILTLVAIGAPRFVFTEAIILDDLKRINYDGFGVTNRFCAEAIRRLDVYGYQAVALLELQIAFQDQKKIISNQSYEIENREARIKNQDAAYENLKKQTATQLRETAIKTAAITGGVAIITGLILGIVIPKK